MLFRYRKKAREDVQRVIDRVQLILASLERPSDSISNDEIERFCKHAEFIRVIRYRSLADEYSPATNKSTEISKWKLLGTKLGFINN
jgi:amyloid beta precursor protein binding protein 1